MHFGRLFFSTYVSVGDEITNLDNAAAELTRITEAFDGKVKAPNLWLQPWRLFNADTPFEFFWRDTEGRYRAECKTSSINQSAITEVTCRVVEKHAYPHMLAAP